MRITTTAKICIQVEFRGCETDVDVQGPDFRSGVFGERAHEFRLNDISHCGTVALVGRGGKEVEGYGCVVALGCWYGGGGGQGDGIFFGEEDHGCFEVGEEGSVGSDDFFDVCGGEDLFEVREVFEEELSGVIVACPDVVEIQAAESCAVGVIEYFEVAC